MPDLTPFSDAATIAYNTLHDHPHINTAAAIACGPYGIEQVDTPEMADALAELAGAEPPIVVATAGGGWRLAVP